MNDMEELVKTYLTIRNERDRIESEFKEQDAALKAENERMRKAGDAMDEYLKRQDGTTNGMLACREAWLSAKEGRNAK